MRLAASFAAAALASTVLATWSTAARADDPGSLSPPLNLSEAPAPPVAQEPEASPEALAPPPPAYELPARQERDHWYGRDILVTDGVSIGAGLGLGLANPGAGLGVFAGGYALGGPIVHLAHGRPLAALGSLALRLGAPTVGLFTGYSIAKVSGRAEDDDAGPAAAALVGVILGYAAAISIDAAVLAHESEDAADDPDSGSRKKAAPPSAAFSWAPTVAPIREGGMVGIGGRF
jgi:hypothetical protein